MGRANATVSACRHAQGCVAWMLSKAPNVTPIPGSSRPETIRSSVAAADLRLSERDVLRLDGPV